MCVERFEHDAKRPSFVGQCGNGCDGKPPSHPGGATAAGLAGRELLLGADGLSVRARLGQRLLSGLGTRFTAISLGDRVIDTC